ncbi:hypothetical protein K2173_018264 [Erythroxylum novogranatense]|uniref:G3BP-like protein n=1 Tax=Erythroxylum novogranatense TaxID=1862640 RepID=A0AAV8U9S6_9ROSI|nr:hypothetical protein K2173_018264 [Erythroxylum novogranatense]
MATSYPAAAQVGSYFVGQYYQVLKQQPNLVHQFYSDASTMIRVDGDSSDTASTMLEIHTNLTSLNFTAIEIKTINSLDSWNGGVLVMVSGSVKIKDFSGRRKFVQTFFLAPQEKGYFVLNDIFQFTNDGNTHQQHPVSMSVGEIYQQHSAPISSEGTIESQINASVPLQEPPVSEYDLEEEAGKYMNSVHIEDDLVDKYSLPEQQQDVESEIVVEEAPVEEIPAPFQSISQALQHPQSAVLEEPLEDPPKRTYASILRVAKGQYPSSVPSQPSFSKTVNPTTSDWNNISPATAQQSDSGFSYATEPGVEASDEGLGFDEGEPKSVYVRNLPSDVTAAEIEQEFQNFGTIKPDGVFIRNRKDVVGVCYAFVEFEDLSSVQNAIKASPIYLAGRQVYIEERRPNSGIASRGGRRGGRGRGGYQTEAARGRFGARSLGRGSNQDTDYNRARGNGFYQRGSR